MQHPTDTTEATKSGAGRALSCVAVFRRFGPRLSEKQRRRLNDSSAAEMAEHGGCWVNDYDCGKPGCVMAEHSALARRISRYGTVLAAAEGR